jgi:predicted transcriptional regulator
MPRPTTLPEPWRSLAANLGGVQALADALGVVPLTVRRYASGEIRMGGAARKLYEALLLDHKIEAT